MARIHSATREILVEWTERLRLETGDGFPEKVTAFREGMAVARAIPAALSGVRHTDPADPLRRERDQLLPVCQTEGRLLADRGLSRLLRQDWPRSLEEMEERLKS